MLFNSLAFAVFFPVVFVVYGLLAHRWQNRALLLASYTFYGWWDPRFLPLIFVSTLVDYGVGLALEASEDPRARKRWLALSLLTNLGLLGVFKYFGFFADSARVLLEGFGLGVSAWHLELALPELIREKGM